MRFVLIVCVVTFAGIGVVAGGLPAVASERSQRFIDEGVAELDRDAWKPALAKFLAASVADPDDHEAQFFQGVAFNRLGRHDAALRQIERARAAGVSNSNMDFELGWAQLGAGQFEQSLETLQRFDESETKLGKTRELMGRAALALGDDSAAEADFREALARDPSLAASIAFFRAGIASAQGDSFASQVTLDKVAVENPTSPLGRAVAGHLELLRSLQAVNRGKLWRLTGSLGVGRNSNVIALGDEQPLPANISSQSSNFARFGMIGEYDVLRESDATATVSYSYLGDRYSSLSTQQSDNHLFAGNYTRRLGSQLIGGVRIFSGISDSDGHQSRKFAGFRVSSTFQMTGDVSFEPAYTNTFSRYNKQGVTANADNRDGATQTFSGLVRFRIPAIETDARVGFAMSDTGTSGSNFDNSARGISFGLSRKFDYDITASIDASRTVSRYDNPDPRAAPAFSENRYDETDFLTMSVSRPLHSNVTAFGRYDVVRNESNIPSFQYRQAIWMMGVVVTY